MHTPHLDLPYLAPAQAQKHVTVNEALRRLDGLIHIAVERRDLTSPPPLMSPSIPATEGQRFLVSSAPTSEPENPWAGQGGNIAAYQDEAWAFFIPRPGWIIWDKSTAMALVFDGAEWRNIAPEIPPLPPLTSTETFGINADADSTNRLLVKSDAVLLSHDDVTPGSGDVRLNLNKAGTANTAALLFQNNYSAHAEFGLTGDDDFHIKVSADGGTFQEAVKIDNQSGRVNFTKTPTSLLQTAHRVTLYTDSRWTSLSHRVYGLNHFSATAIAGAGGNPNEYWQETGHFLPAGTHLFRLFILGRATNVDVEDIEIFVRLTHSISNSQWEEAGLSSANHIQTRTLHHGLFLRPDGPDTPTGNVRNMHKLELELNYILPSDGIFNILYRPVGTLASIRHFYNMTALEYNLG